MEDRAGHRQAGRGPGGGRTESRSPVCYAGEADPAYMGYMPDSELVDLLNTLLEAERAGARVLTALVQDHDSAEARELLRRVRRDEARYCALLTGLVERIGGTPSQATGAFRDKVLALEDRRARLGLLNRGQRWVARRLDEALPRIARDDVHAALREMRDTHLGNIDACEALVARL